MRSAAWRRLSAFGNFEEGEQAVVAYIEKVMADPL
jgi:hypothetical protein